MSFDIKKYASPKIIEIVIPVLSFIGICISAYLTYSHFTQIETICLPGMHCDEVLSSPYSEMWGIPVYLLGFLMYVVMSMLGMAFYWGVGFKRNTTALLIYVVSLSAFLFNLYLYYLEIFVIHAFCTWCVASSLIVLSLLVISCINLRNIYPLSCQINTDFRPGLFVPVVFVSRFFLRLLRIGFVEKEEELVFQYY